MRLPQRRLHNACKDFYIVPVYNVEKYLAQCLESCIKQTLRDIEIICVNDCSPDNSQKILEKYRQRDTRIKVINHEENKGLGAARNTGIKADVLIFQKQLVIHQLICLSHLPKY